ncbi:MAG: glycosyltransferase family 2 protein [Dehalococcoidales bacterium]|nr:glycosyltransferase family 2 protein [Dehalococcoidales bacterium]
MQTTIPETTVAQKIVIVIPAYNEERFIGSVVLKALKFGDTVLVVDDGSSDETAEIAAAAGAIVVQHAVNSGKGVALRTAFRKARELGADVVVTLDADGQHLPEEMAMVAAPVLRGEADIVVGSRYLERTSEVPSHRIWGHAVFNLITNGASGVTVTDSQSGYRAFSAKALTALSFHSNGFSVESEMQFLARENGLRVAEVPITIRYRDKPKRNVIVHGLMVLNGILQLIGQHRPLLFFGVPGFISLLVGMLWGVWVVEIYRMTSTLAIGYALIAVFLSIVGVLALFTGVMLHSVRGLLLSLVRPRDSSSDSLIETVDLRSGSQNAN